MKAITALRLVRLEMPVRAGDVCYKMKVVTALRLVRTETAVSAVTSIIR